MNIAGFYLIVLTLSGYVFTCSMPKIVEQGKAFPVGDYQYIGYDKNGDKIVEGRLSITSAKPRRIGSEKSTELKGTWQLKKIGNQERIGPQVGTGDLQGSIDKGEVYINLNPNMNDNNVYLGGKIEGKRFHGKWRFSGIAGTLSQGTFEAIRK